MLFPSAAQRPIQGRLFTCREGLHQEYHISMTVPLSPPQLCSYLKPPFLSFTAPNFYPSFPQTKKNELLERSNHRTGHFTRHVPSVIPTCVGLSQSSQKS